MGVIKKSKIKSIKAIEILDSRGNPTIKAFVETNNGIFVGLVPSGASTGKNEALELRDGEKRYFGKGVLKAVENINNIIAPALAGKNPLKQEEIDKLMIELDGTGNKMKLGANATLAVSMAICRAGAGAKNIPLYRYIAEFFFTEKKEARNNLKLPFASFNILNGGLHAGNGLDIQEFMVIPQKKSFSENLKIASEIYHYLKSILEENFGKQAVNVGDEGGFAPPLSYSEEALALVNQAIKIHSETKIGIDCAATQFYKDGKYDLEGNIFTPEGLIFFYKNLIEKYPIVFLEDPFSEEDWENWKKITSELKNRITIIGDDLLTTNPLRIKEAEKRKACNGVIIKPNQIGTISETLEAVKLAKSFGWKVIVSHRSGETCDDFIADLAVGVKADFIKSGAPARGERVAKYNRLLEIEREIKRNKI